MHVTRDSAGSIGSVAECPEITRSNIERAKRPTGGEERPRCQPRSSNRRTAMSDFVYLFRATEAQSQEAMGTPEHAQQSMQAWLAWIRELETNGPPEPKRTCDDRDVQPRERGRVLCGTGRLAGPGRARPRAGPRGHRREARKSARSCSAAVRDVRELLAARRRNDDHRAAR
jgi:hypothetical protein